MGAALHFPDVQRPRFNEILSFTQIPDPIWTDKTVSDLEVRVHGYLVLWMRLHPGRFPEIREVAVAIGRAECTVRRAVQALDRSGYLVLEKRGKRSRYYASMGYRLKTPGPKLARHPVAEQQGRLFPDDTEERAPAIVEARTSDRQIVLVCAPPINTEREREDRLACTRDVVRPFSLQPLTEEDLALSEHEGLLLARAAALGLAEASPKAVSCAVHEFGATNVGDAITVAEQRAEPPGNWRFVVTVLENWRKEGKLDKKNKLSNDNKGAPPPRSASPHKAGSREVPLTKSDVPDAEISEALKIASGRGADARVAKTLLRHWMTLGLVHPEMIPPDLAASMSEKIRPGARSANSPPGRLEVQTGERSIIP